jgi:guanylate kinase
MKHPEYVILEVREKMRQLAETASKSTGRGHKIEVRLSERGRTEENGGQSRLEDAQKEDSHKKSRESLDRNSNQEEAVAGREITSAARS